MKKLDKLLRAWRTNKALKAAPAPLRSVLDIGCGDGYLLRRLGQAERRDGIDPTLEEDLSRDGMLMRRGAFPPGLERAGMTGPYDAIFSLAVFEHLTEEDFISARANIPALLRPGGRLIITVPHPLVDRILDILMFLKLVEGQSVHEHHGFNPGRIVELESDKLVLIRKSTFQLGMNNLFVFERK